MANPVPGFNPALPPPVHIARNLPLSHQQSEQPTRGVHTVPPSYVNPVGTVEETTFHSPQTWPLGITGPGEIGITMEPQPPTDGANQKQKEDDDTDSESTVSDAPTVQHFNVSDLGNKKQSGLTKAKFNRNFLKSGKILLRFLFKKTFREHPGVYSINCARTCLALLYKCTLTVTYNIFLLLCGFILAAIWGVINGLVAFFQTWCLSPLLRIMSILVKGFLPIILDPLSMLLKVVHEACNGTSPGGMIAGAVQKIGGLAG